MKKYPSAVLSLVSFVAFSLLFIAGQARGQIVFQDNFDDLLSEFNWAVNRSGSDSVANFAFNYADLGIPPAPHSNGTTVGLGFLVNQGFDPTSTAGAFQGISVSPLGQSFTGDFQIRFDMWLNFVGPFPDGGSGTTQAASFGWGTSGSGTQWADTKHSAMFAATLDGGSDRDYRAYLRELATEAGATIDPSIYTSVYAAGTLGDLSVNDARNDTNAYYSVFGGKSAPAAQLADFPTQTGTTRPGALGMAWRDVVLEKIGNNISWTVDGVLIATIPLEAAVLGGDNLFLGMFDTNANASIEPHDELNTAIFDNIVVEVIPEPTSLSLLGLAVAGVGFRRRRA
jgi:hypothetical protein